MTPRDNADDNAAGELVETRPADPIRIAFGAAIRALAESLGECPALDFAMRELVEAEARTRRALVRRVLN